MNRKLGDSALSRSFGASVKVVQKDQTLTLVIGRGGSPNPAIRGLGGRTVMEFSRAKVLALMSVQQIFALRRHPAIEFAGPVAIDAERHAQFLARVRTDS